MRWTFVSVDTREAEQEALGRVKVNKLVKAFKDHQEAEGRVSPLSERQMGVSTNFKGYERKMVIDRLPRYRYSLKRGVLAFLRQNSLLLVRIGSTLGLSVCVGALLWKVLIVITQIGIGLFFSPIGDDYASIQSRVGCIQKTLPP